MSHILHRMLSKSYPTATGGEGMVLRDRDGREHIDASGGAAVSCLGHGHPDVLAAMHAQIDKLAYAHTQLLHHRRGRRARRPSDRAGAGRN